MTRLLSFKQYLSESRRVLSEDMPVMDYDGERAPGYEYSRKLQVPRKLGDIGPYRVWHHEVHPEAEGEAVSVHFGDKQVGLVPLEKGSRFQGKGTVVASMPSFDPAHRGKKAKVRNLAPKVYAMIADKVAPIESGIYQTPGSRSVWKRLAGMRSVKVRSRGSNNRTLVSYSHPAHEGMSVDSDGFSRYVQAHREASALMKRKERTGRRLSQRETNDLNRSLTNDLEYAINRMRNRLIDSGANKRKARRMSKLEHFPKPEEFKRTATKLSSPEGNYSPEKHDTLVYHPQIGTDYTLVLPPSGRKKKK